MENFHRGAFSATKMPFSALHAEIIGRARAISAPHRMFGGTAPLISVPASEISARGGGARIARSGTEKKSADSLVLGSYSIPNRSSHFWWRQKAPKSVLSEFFLIFQNQIGNENAEIGPQYTSQTLLSPENLVHSIFIFCIPNLTKISTGTVSELGSPYPKCQWHVFGARFTILCSA